MDASKSRNASNICTISAAWVPSNCMVASDRGEAYNSKEAVSKLKPTTTGGICQKQP